MKFKPEKLIILAALVFTVIVTFAVYNMRSPVLIVSEQHFINYYGENRIKRGNLRSSLALFRPVKMVVVANDVGDDIIPHAVAEISNRPYCVLFPYRFTRSARMYKEQNPQIPVIFLHGRSSGNTLEHDLVYKTDIDSDFYRAALAASALAKDGKIAVFLDYGIQAQARTAFLQGLDPEKASEVLFYTAYSQIPDEIEFSCVVLAGAGNEFLDKKSGVPVITFSWLAPSLVPSDVVLIINDSPLVQTVGAVKLLSANEIQGQIGSKFTHVNGRNVERKILRKIKKIR